MVLKIQAPFPVLLQIELGQLGGLQDNNFLVVYNESRDFVAYVANTDPGFPALKNWIVSKGVPCLNPGKKGHFFTKLRRDMRLDVYLDRMTHEAW